MLMFFGALHKNNSETLSKDFAVMRNDEITKTARKDITKVGQLLVDKHGNSGHLANNEGASRPAESARNSA